jgi:hypothetical protein
MFRIPDLLGRAILSGTTASLTAGVALAVAARAEGKGAAQPINATSHWREGQDAGEVRAVDGRHTAVGYGTHLAATIFWALLFEWLARPRPGRKPRLLRSAAITTAVAVVADYGLTPRRFTPGWELVLSVRGMAAAYGGMGLGFVLARAATGGSR